jgi:DNA-binding LacI/PurR family transcriptional regulator
LHRRGGFARRPGRAGWERALREAGLEPREEWCFSGGEWQDHEACGVALARRFLALPVGDRPSAACIVNDEAAQSFIVEAARGGLRVPEDFSVAGQDDMPIARLGAVPLTTVPQPVEAIARRVVEMLCSRLDGSYGGPPRRDVLRGELRVRQSSAPPAPG